MKRNNYQGEDALPGELSAALAEAEAVLKKHNALATVLAETGTAIPQGLASERELSAELGMAEITGEGADELRARLAAVQEGRRGDVRRRQSATEGLLGLESELAKARQQVTASQAVFASTVIQDFERRWADACRALDILRSEAAQLSAGLRVPVPVPAPYMATVNAIHGTPELRPVALAGQVPPAALPPALAATVGVFDRLDAASALSSGLQHAVQLNAQHHALSRLRGGQQIEMSGTFTVVRPFRALGSDFPAGALVDRSVVPDGLLYRFWRGRNLQPSEGRPAAA